MTTAEQRLAALDAANQIRSDRKDVREAIGAGRVSAAAVLDEWPECIHGCGAFQFVCFLPMVGKGRGQSSSRAFLLLRKANAPGHKRLDQLTAGQLERLTRVVREYETNRHPAERNLT